MPDRQPVALYHGESLKRYAFGDGHPFGPDRLDAFWRHASERGLPERVELLAPVAADPDVLERFHTRGHIERVRAASARGTGFLDCGDTPAFPGVFEAALIPVGTTLDAARRLARGEHRRVFIPIAGFHHARRDAAGGFCTFNDIGVAIESLRAEHGIRRIAYVDIDAHHGDGVFYGFEDDPDLCFVDLHEDGRFLYPGTGSAEETGRGIALGTKLNIPMPPGADDREFLAAWSRAEGFLRAAAPELFVFQCGADSLDGDPITHLRYSPAAHAQATRSLTALAERFAGGRLLVMGGGGYDRANLARAWTAVVEILLEA